MIGKSRIWLLSAICLAGLDSPWARADEPAEPAAPVVAPAAASAEPVAGAATARPQSGSTIDLAILLDEHLAILRFELRRGETPCFQLWQEFVEGKFNAADKDHNGVLDAEEFATVKPLLAVPSNANNRNSNVVVRRPNQVENQQLVVDPMNDEAASQIGPGVTCDEFVEALRTTTSGPVQIRANFQPSPASRALFTRLDANHDGKLSSGECERAFEALHPLDLVEADLFGPFQLTGGNPNVNGVFRVAGQSDQAPAHGARARLAVKLLRSANSASSLAWADRIRQHFASRGPQANAPKNLPRTVMLYDEATFATMDADGDGTLDQDELVHFTRQSMPNVELSVDLSQQGAPAATGMHLASACHFESAARTRSELRPAKLTTGVEELEMTSIGPAAANGPRQGVNLVANLKQFDTDNNGYLEERELKRFNATGLMALDANGDGKLFFNEISDYMDAQSEAAAVRLAVVVVDHDHAMFDALDTNHDGQLGRRELRQLTGRLTAWDRNGDGELAFEEVPRLYSIQIAPDQPRVPNNPFGFGNGNVTYNQNIRMQARTSPTWFTQMDRNSDGDLSRREFLGTAAQFRQFDTDGDQLIDAEEAARAGQAATATVTLTAPDDSDDP